MSTENQKDSESTEHMFDVGVDESVDETVEGLPEISPLEPMAVLEEQVGLLKDQLMRAHAEMENVRRRAAEDVSKAHKFSIERFANELLPVQESLEKALSDTTGDLTTLREGVELTQKQLTNALEKVVYWRLILKVKSLILTTIKPFPWFPQQMRSQIP